MEPLMSFEGYQILQDETQSRKLLNEYYKSQGYKIKEETHMQLFDVHKRLENYGHVIERWDIGDYIITKVKFDSSIHDIYGFFVFIDGNMSDRYWSTLEQALIGMVAIKYDGSDTKADSYFFKMIKK